MQVDVKDATPFADAHTRSDVDTAFSGLRVLVQEGTNEPRYFPSESFRCELCSQLLLPPLGLFVDHRADE